MAPYWRQTRHVVQQLTSPRPESLVLARDQPSPPPLDRYKAKRKHRASACGRGAKREETMMSREGLDPRTLSVQIGIVKGRVITNCAACEGHVTRYKLDLFHPAKSLWNTDLEGPSTPLKCSAAEPVTRDFVKWNLRRTLFCHCPLLGSLRVSAEDVLDGTRIPGILSSYLPSRIQDPRGGHQGSNVEKHMSGLPPAEPSSSSHERPFLPIGTLRRSCRLFSIAKLEIDGSGHLMAAWKLFS